jgi:hypothetical protein
VAIRGRPTTSPNVRVIVEINQPEFVAKIPEGLHRTVEGDLDFERYRAFDYQIEEFEFDRVVLTFAGRPGDRYARLRNLAQAGVWNARDMIPDALARYQQLVAESGLDPRQRAELLEVFQRRRPFLK